MADNKKIPLFHLEGKPVFKGYELHVSPSEPHAGGESVKALDLDGIKDGILQVRTLDKRGQSHTISVLNLGWREHPDANAVQEMKAAGIGQPTARDIQVWMAARSNIKPLIQHEFSTPIGSGICPETEHQILGFIANDFFITEPFSSECGRFEVDPMETYGISREDAFALQSLNAQVKSITYATISAMTGSLSSLVGKAVKFKDADHDTEVAISKYVCAQVFGSLVFPREEEQQRDRG